MPAAPRSQDLGQNWVRAKHGKAVACALLVSGIKPAPVAMPLRDRGKDGGYVHSMRMEAPMEAPVGHAYAVNVGGRDCGIGNLSNGCPRPLAFVAAKPISGI